jgi:hypothetical protein
MSFSDVLLGLVGGGCVIFVLYMMLHAIFLDLIRNRKAAASEKPPKRQGALGRGP